MSKTYLFKNRLKTTRANGQATPTDSTLLTSPGRWQKQAETFDNVCIGSTTATTDGSGEIAITHGATFTPDHAILTVSGDNQYIARVKSLTSTTLTVVVKNDAGSDVTSTSVTVYWQVAKI